MLRSLRAIPRILALCWPALFAWYLGGSLVRAVVLAIAAPIGPESALAALLLVPLAALARLISYVGMFLAVRRGMRAYRDISGGDVEFESLRDAASEFLNVLLASIIPFFFLYAVLGLLAEDLSDYAQSAFKYAFGTDGSVLQVGDGPLVLVVILVALAARILLKIYGSKLPRGFGVLEVYFEATWVFVALTGLGAVFGQAIAWIEGRQVVRWVEDIRDFILGLGDGVRWLLAQFDWLGPVVAQLILLPLAWLLIAGIIYTRALANIEPANITDTVPERLTAVVRPRFEKLPAIIRRQAYLVTDEWDDLGGPFSQSGKLIAGAGIRSLAIFAAAYALLYAASQWLLFGAYRLFGPHDRYFWNVIDPVMDVAVSIITEPLRVVLLAAAFDYCLRKWQEKQVTAPAGADGSSVPRPA
ncbi:hypothetical protein EYE40_03955 [Glaciihabitans arcticus]|uniref:Uncharacterized protein n=1 Tax=Glaciihabitans arcticus TaxID=2668039 RepID=A0A4Q9GTY9_9MICO|nr:hypothetical protein [Glaciihabitans arcticus]TBN56617.1 hypothetical protein EYE40_03955 [Glaciihabitans arcticus]